MRLITPTGITSAKSYQQHQFNSIIFFKINWNFFKDPVNRNCANAPMWPSVLQCIALSAGCVNCPLQFLCNVQTTNWNVLVSVWMYRPMSCVSNVMIYMFSNRTFIDSDCSLELWLHHRIAKIPIQNIKMANELRPSTSKNIYYSSKSWSLWVKCACVQSAVLTLFLVHNNRRWW